MNWKCFSFLLVVLIVNVYAKKQYTVALLLHGDDNITEIAFKTAVDRFNLFNVRIRFQAVTKIVSKTDTFSVYNTVCEMISTTDKLVGIFGPSSQRVVPIVESICTTLEMPHIQIHWVTGVPLSHTSLNFHPDYRLLSTAIETVVKSLSWNQIAILYQDDNSLIRLQKVFALQGKLSEKVYMRQLKRNGDNRMILKELKKLGQVHIIIDCDSDRILSVLQEAKEVQMLEDYYTYFLTSLDAHTLNYHSLNTRANFTTIRMLDPESTTLQNAVRDWEVGEKYFNRKFILSFDQVKLEAGLMHDAAKFFTERFYELYLTQKPDIRELRCQEGSIFRSGFRIASYLRIRNMEDGVTNLIKFQEGSRSTLTLQVVEIINGTTEAIAEWSSDNPKTVGVLRSETDLRIKQMDIFMQNSTFTVTSRLGPPYLMKRKARYEGEVLEGNSRFEGYSLDLIDLIAEKMNISYKFILAEDGKYGNYDPKTKSWNGLIKDLLDRRAHLAICDLTITHQRRQVVDFSLPFMTLGISILYSKAKTMDRDIYAFMHPFDTTVWMYIATGYISVSLIVYIVFRVSPGEWESPHPCDGNPTELTSKWTFKNCSYLMLGSTMSCGCPILPKGISSRMLISTWWFFILIFNSSYKANLVAFLTKVRMGPTIHSAEGLSMQTRIKYGTVQDGATQTFFKESNFSTYQRMWTQMSQWKPSVFEKSNADGVRRVKTTRNQKYAFLMESSSIEYVIERDCDLKQVGGLLDSKAYGIAMPMNSPYRAAVNAAILKMQEDGTLGALKRRWWKEMHGGGACDKVPTKTNSDSLALANVGGVFVVVGAGLLIAFVISAIEFLWTINEVALEERKSFWEILVSEVRFAVRIWSLWKRTNFNEISTSRTGDSSILKSTE